MKIDLNAALKDLRGKEMKEVRTTKGPDGLDAPEEVKILLGDIIVNAFQTALKGDADKGPVEVARLHKLASRVAMASGAFELTPEEATLIRDRIAKAYYLPVAGPALELLEG